MFGMYSLPHLYQIIRQIPSKSFQKQAFQNLLYVLYKAKLVIFVSDSRKPFNKQESVCFLFNQNITRKACSLIIKAKTDFITCYFTFKNIFFPMDFKNNNLNQANS